MYRLLILPIVTSIEEEVDPLHVVVLITESLRVLQIDTSLLVSTGDDVPAVGKVLDGEVEIDPLSSGEVDDLADA